VVERAGEERRATLVTDTMVPADSSQDHPHRRFLDRHGFTLNNTEIVRHLALPVSEDLLSRLADQARPRFERTYRLETHVNGAPVDQLPRLTSVMNQLSVDAPTGDLELEEESFDPARYAEYLQLERQQKRTRLTTVAIHVPTGDVVAYSDLILPAGAPTTVWQWGTLVHRDHRGHRLGMAVKVDNLRRLQIEDPGRERVVTGNDDTNSWMVSINERLGFEVVELCPAYQRKLG
jgi:alkylated DNA nucleotide flippase Atl1